MLSNVSVCVHIAAAMRAVHLFAREKHHAEVAVTKWAALCKHRDERPQHDTPQSHIYQRPDAIVSAAAVQAEPEQNQNGRNTVPELWTLHATASKNHLEHRIAFLCQF